MVRARANIVVNAWWAAIASYLPQRTDNDIKNYWNTHLKKNLDRLLGNSDQENHHQPHGDSKGRHSSLSSETIMSRGQWERRLQTDIHMAKQALCEALSIDNKSINLPDLPSSQSTTTYASSAENIARLLPNWMNSSNKSSQTSSESIETTWFQSPLSEGYENSLQFESNNNLIHNNQKKNHYLNYRYSDVSQSVSAETSTVFQDESKPNMKDQMPPLSSLEKWLFDEATTQADLMNMSLEESDDFF
ncbi:hypothetical protein L1987_51725 [Smallanthus sonchifolius]|uniref:Uncharacterized protein n=1 Tax=Smallanthus sonchifolius TaxID=185202 RepID=A0ACB9ERV8_9ASTR|nr:hypothetical protein L1987_51725 [Smallanthus sonchifolius]